ncbi:MAG: hypothetical protein ACI8PG_003123 [Planctomycetota bacterium]|jgi:hypothetical protein
MKKKKNASSNISTNMPKALLKIKKLFLLCLLVALPVHGDEATYTLRGFDARIQRGIDLIYNLHFDEADAHFAAIIKADPENPLGYFFSAMVAWWRVLIDLENRTHDEAFYKKLEQCIAVCDQRLKEDPLDFDAILFKGGAIGFRGRLRGDRNQYIKAARDGLRSLSLLDKSRQLEPSNKDILFGQGLYNYFAKVMPKRHAIIRPVMIFLPDGDRELGLEQLRQVAKEGLYARTEAAYFLAQIYRIFENDSNASLPYLQTLYARYPTNALFHRYTARTLVEVGRWPEAIALYGQYTKRHYDGQTGYHVYGHIEARYYLGRYAFFRRQYAKAREEFLIVDQLMEDSPRESDLAYAALANLYLGMAADTQKNLPEAQTRYKKVLELPEYDGSHKRAKRFLKKSYSAKK